ncbi:uncharacterized protein TA05690 [Theileria annulata]|uniref:Nucleoporin protein Ndc1-Nup n=1 Tax=Theileria annulata TaxID=5874 RepID=Q4UHY3_THEAN|nr:uncharacterized protein TA05690 [Theileria annulata]CAI73306.1 hypothetical protein TA05690 [Theileria annulata]|eukprot:XP_953983.1 hypothetical protein TA05690 [Theileria annulata]
MAKTLSWDDVKWRSSIRVFSSILKYHISLTLSLSIFNLVLFNIFRFLISSNKSPIINLWNSFFNLFPSFFFLLLSLCFRHISFKGSFVRSMYLDFCSFISNFLMVFAIILTANTLIKIKITEPRLFFVLLGCFLNYLKVRKQNTDVCKVLDKQNITTVHLGSFFFQGFFNSLLSYFITLLFFSFLNILYFLSSFLSSSFPNVEAYKYRNFLTHFCYDVNALLSKLPYTTNYYHFSFNFIEGLELFLAQVWILSLSDYYLDKMNLESTHMDYYIMNYIDEMPIHNVSNINDEMLYARAAYNYTKGVSYTLNNMNMKYVSNPISFKYQNDWTLNGHRQSYHPFERVPNSSFFQKSTPNNTYTLEAKKDRYQLDPVVYKMLMDKTKNFWSNYVQSCLETMDESSQNLHHLIDYPFSREHKINILENNMHQFNLHQHQMGFYTSFQSFLLYLASYFKFFHPSKSLSNNLVNMLLLCIVYLRGITSWLCIANMIGHSQDSVKIVAKDVIVQSLRIHRALSNLNLTTIPSNIKSYIETLNNDINTTLKRLAVYTETLIYSKFDTNFDTYRLMEHLYNNRKLST